MKKLSIVVAGLILMFWSGVAHSQESKNAVSLFIQGGIAYKQGDYTAAIQDYEEILQSGLENGPLYFNLANAYYKKGELGKAILNYERAKKFLPRDGDLNFNYRYALSQVKNESEEKSSTFLQRLLEGHRQFYSFDEMVAILTILVILLSSIYLLSLYGKWPRKVRRLTVILLGTLAIVYTVGLFYKVTAEGDLAIILKESPAKFEPRQEATIYFELATAEKVKVVKQEGEWYKIQREDGKMGWIIQTVLERI